jgi:hypothetical protein
MEMSLGLSLPRLARIEGAIRLHPKFAPLARRPTRPKLKVEERHFQRGAGEPEPSDRPGTFTIAIIDVDGTPAGPFTAGAEPGIATAAAGPLAPAEEKAAAPPRDGRPVRQASASRATKPAPRPKRRPATEEDLLAQIASLEARRDELLHGPRARLGLERVLRQGGKPKGGPAGKAAGKHRSGPTAHVKGRQRRTR